MGGAANAICRFKGGLSRGTVGGKMFYSEEHLVKREETIVRVK